MAVDRSKWPPMVRIGLWGVQNRAMAWAFAAGSVVLAIVCLMLSFKDPRFFGGVALIFAALWYYSAIRWVDKHDQWA